MPYSITPHYFGDPREDEESAFAVAEPSEIMQLHDALIPTHNVEMSDDLSELWVSGGRLSAVDSGEKGKVTIYIWPYSGSAPLTYFESIPAETALEVLQSTPA